MSENTKQITKQFHVIKGASDLTQPDDGLWAIASAETPDSSGDVVIAKGLTWDQYHNPPVSYLKILANHQMTLPSGEPPIIGRVEEFRRTSLMVGNKAVPAVAFRFSWAKDGEGNVTPLAQAYKDLYDGGYMDSFSVGMMVMDCEPNDLGGIDIKEASLYEISAVTVPCLPQANAIRMTLKGLGVAVPDAPEPVTEPKSIDNLLHVIEGVEYVTKAHYDEMMDRLSATYEHAMKAQAPHLHASDVEGVLSKQLAPITDSLKAFCDRLDLLESSVVVLTNRRKSVAEDTRKTTDIDPQAIATLKAKLDGLASFVGR